MRIKTFAAAILLSVAASSGRAGTFYTDEASFLLAIDPVFYLEDFSSFTFGNPLDGTQLTYDAPGGNGYDWTAISAGLYSNNSALSVSLNNTPIILQYTGSPVTALGGLFANTDVTGAIIPGTITITTSDGGMQSFNITTEAFFGYTTTMPINSVTFSATNGDSNFIQVDHLYTGAIAAVPEPATISLSLVGFGLTALAARRRRRREQS